MSSTDALQARALAAKGAVQTSYDDAPVMIRLRYIGTGSVTSVVVTTATNLVMTTTDGGVDTYAFATYSTVGALVDKINTDGIFEAKTLDALRSDSVAGSQIVENTTIVAGTDTNGVVSYDLHTDTSVLKATTATLSLSRNWNYPPKIKLQHRVHLTEIDYNENVGGTIANGVVVYFRLNSGQGMTETLQFSRAAANTTATTINFQAGMGKLTAPEGADIIVRVLSTGTQTDATGNYVQAVGIYE